MEEQASVLCHGFRTKNYYTEGERGPDWADCAPTSGCWCVHTTTVLGPDDVLWSLEMCRPGRACFRPPACE